MSADITDVARIQDEDVLRRMWQETNDFGRKKEIRSHMYKLREARLKDFYNSADVNTEIRRSTTTSTSSENTSKSNMSTTHADSLADQSYVTLKSKEVRDSESPTRDSYNKTIAKHQDQGWTINTSHDRSLDGKTHTSTHSASTSGTQKVDGGKIDYAAKLEEKATVFQDGDDKNFTRTVGQSSSSVVHQEGSGGDGNSHFRSSSSKTTSSSSYVSESKNSSEDVKALPSSTTIIRGEVPYSSINEENAKSVVQKTFTTNIPSDLKNHPSYVEGKTKVTQETKTLGDGTIVTTTKYETKQGNSTQTATHKKYSNIASSHSEQRSSSSNRYEQSSRNFTSSDSKHSTRNDQKAIEYVVEPGSCVDVTVNNVDRRQQDMGNRNERISSQQVTSKVVRETTQNDYDDVGVRQNRKVQENVEYVEIPLEIPYNQTSTTKTTTTKTVVSQKPQQIDTQQRVTQERNDYVEVPMDKTISTKTTTTTTVVSDEIPKSETKTHHTTSVHTVNQKTDVRDSKKVVSDQFVTTERQHEVNTRETQRPVQQTPIEPNKPSKSPERQPKAPQEPYVQPDKRQPIRPGKSELDQRPTPTDGQYDTTYRSEFTNKKISVEVSATHDAFARSLRSITPERITRGSPRSGSNQSLRSTSSPEKMRFPSRTSPDRYDRSRSPKKSTEKFSSSETITYTNNRNSPLRKSPERRPINGDLSINKTTKSDHYSTDTITRKTKTTRDETHRDTVDTSTLTRRKTRPRSPSPTCTTTSDFEYTRSTKDVTTDLDEDSSTTRKTTKNDIRPSSLELTTRKPKKVTERSPTSPLTDFAGPYKSPSPKKDRSPSKDSTFERPKLVRTDTYEERVKEILGLSKDTNEIRRSSLDRNSLKKSSLRETTTRTNSCDDVVRRLSKPKSPEKQVPDRKSPIKDYPSQARKSPEKVPSRRSPTKEKPTISEFPSQIRKSPEKTTFERSPEKKSPTKTAPTISEFPSQKRKSPEKEYVEPYPTKTKPPKTGPSVSEFPSQIRKSPEKAPLEPYPERKSPSKSAPTISEFPSQIKKSPEKEPLEPYPEKQSPKKSATTIREFPSQIQKSPEREPMEPYPERKSPTKSGPAISEFPSQIRKSPEREPLEPYPEKKSPTKSGPTISEFPSQIRKSPEREPLEPYPERKSPTKSGPTISEFPSQIRKTPEKEPLEPYPERSLPSKTGPTINEFPSQVRKSPGKQPLEPYPEKKSPEKYPSSISEFPSQIRKSPEREILEPYPERTTPTKQAPTISEFPSQTKKLPEKQTPGQVGSVPSQVRKSPEKSVDFITPKRYPKKPKKVRTVSESSTSEDEEDIQETIDQTYIETVESRVPVEEPVIEKKLFSTLCREDEVRQLDKKKTTQDMIEAEILENEITREQVNKTVKKEKPLTNGIKPKETPKKTSTQKVTTATDTQKKCCTTKIASIKKDTSPVKKPIEKTPSRKTIETTITSTRTQVKKDSPKTTTVSPKLPTPKKQPQTIYRVEKTKFIGETEYQDEYSKTNKLKKEPIKKLVKPGSKTTLYQLENLENAKEDKSVHIRTNRVDDTVTKKKVSKTILVNGDASKTKPTERMPSPVKKTPVSLTSIPKPDSRPKQSTISQSRYTTTTVKKTGNDIKPKSIKPTEPKKHVVSATINVTSKLTPKTTTQKTTALKTAKTAKTSKKTTKRVTNGYISSDTDEESMIESVEGSFIDLTQKRTSKGLPDMYPEDEETTRRVITTKTVLITNEDGPDREVVVNLQRSKSSREPTPDRLCPRPLTSDEEEDLSPIRYPDQISEPDDGSTKKKPKKLSDIPIYESDDTEFTRITEMTDTRSKISKVDKVEETDESLLSVNKKISKFLNTADQLTREPLKSKPGKVERPSLEVTEDLKEDECLLSVSDKVSKFISTAEQLTNTGYPERPRSPRPKEYGVSIQKKVTEYKSSVEDTTKVEKDTPPKVERPDLNDVEDSLKEDECLLSVSDKVSKFISTAEKLSTTSTKPVSLAKIEVRPVDHKPKDERVSPTKQDRKSPSKDFTNEFIRTETKEEIKNRKSPSLSPERRRSPSPGEKIPNRRPSGGYSTITTETTETKYTSISPEPTPKSTRRTSQEDTKSTLSSTTRLRSTESIKKAKALFENIGKEQDTPWQKDILSRPSVFDAKRSTKVDKATIKTSVEEKHEVSRRTSAQRLADDTRKLVETITRRSQSPQKSPERTKSPERLEITRFRSRSPEKNPDVITPHQEPKLRSRDPTPEGDLPHYMKPLDRSLRPNSPHRDGVIQAKPQQPQTVDQVDTRQTKFGVTLRRTDSGRATKTTESSHVTTERRKSSITLEKRVTEEEVEEIFELEVLEELLEKVVGYELRRKIRAQIRLVKKLIQEGSLETYILKRKPAPREAITRRGSSPAKTVKPSETISKTTEYQSTYTRKVSPERKVVDNKLFKHTDLVDNRRSSIEKTEKSTEYQSSYSYNERRSSTECSKITRKSVSPVKDRASPQRTSPERRVSKTIDVVPGGKITTVKTTETIPGGMKTTTTKTTEKSFTTLKKTLPPTKRPVENTQPEWVKQRNLRNAKESAAPVGKKTSTSTSTSTSTIRKSTLRTSPAKEVKGTDIITSSYGVGPTDENGTPLFGLRALRAQNKNEKIKVQGTVIRSEYYSENDQEPVGQVSVTKYSTDPTDLDQDGVVSSDGKVASITTTQKFGYKDTPSLRSLTDNKKEICDVTEKSTTTKTTKLNRRGSVKEMSKKFIDNAVESLKSERQTTYPKAGLILRSSSFKSTNGEGSPSDSRESSPANDRESESTVTVRTMKTSTRGETFLSNKNQISGVQDVITRMKNEDYVEGDTEEDIAARGLLNKFLGSQVILSGMEARAASSSSMTSTSPGGTVRRSTKITTTVTEGGKPTTSTRVFERPVSEKELETVWDEQSLRLLLEQSTDYEERRTIRVRLREVMAEQEACTALVDEATRGEERKTPTTPTAPGQIEGESQLLPLLQGLLDAPGNDITPDSGTESGEDQRSSLIAEVQTALEKLSSSLRSDQTDITPERRSSLLQLVTKLQAGLSGSGTTERRASTVSNGGRFQKRKNKQARHTVGVSKEELADARKLIEQISLNDCLTPSGSTSKLELSKQNSESSVPTSSASSSYRNVHHKVKNSTAKPFSSSNTSSSAQTPTEHFDGFDSLFNDEKDITSHEAPTVQQKATASFATTAKPNYERNTSVDSNASIKSAYKAIQQAAASKVAALKREQSREQTEEEEFEEEEIEEEEEEEDDGPSTIKGASDLENASLKSNPIYSKPADIYEERSSRFDTQKKLRMKRANTIDIPKPLNFYEDEDDSESEFEHDAQKRRESYYALRGPINVHNPHTKKIVPTFEPKTDSDKKFIAFINKHNENGTNKGSVWAANNSSVWGNRFGNIKNNFEKTSAQDAKSFWKSADDNIKKSNSNQFGPKISRRSARNLQQMFEEKQKENQRSLQHKVPVQHQQHAHTQNHHQHQNVVTGKLQVKTEPEKQYRVVPQPLPVNQFSHAPQSAFRPIKKTPQSNNRSSLLLSPEGGEILKSEIKETSGSSFLYSPKPMSNSSVESSTVTSPVGSKPWAATTGGSRVLSLAASKFEQPPPQEPPIKPRRSSRDIVPKVFAPANQVKSNLVDRTPSYLAKTADSKSSTVRKLSGNYENHNNKTNNYQPKPQTYQVKTSVVESQYTPPVKHYEPNVRAPVYQASLPPSENYSIRYDQPQTPQNYSIRYDQMQNLPNQFQQPQNYSIRYDHPQNQQVNYNQQQSVPQNYSIRYDQPRPQYQSDLPQQTYQPQNYSIRPQAPPVVPQNYNIRYDQVNGQEYQNKPAPKETSKKQENEIKEYTSSCQFKPASQAKVPVQIIEPVVQAPKVQRQTSNESVHEHNAVSSRVMSGPVSQQAVTVRQKSPMSRDQHDMEAAFGLKNSLQKVGKQEPARQTKTSPAKSPVRTGANSTNIKPKEPEKRQQSFKYKSEIENSESTKYKPSDCPKPTVSPSSFRFKSNFEETHKETKNCGVVKPMQQQQKATPIYNNTTNYNNIRQSKEKSSSIVTGQFHIPAINVKPAESPRAPTQAQVLSKSDSWLEICLAHQSNLQKPIPKPGPVKSKSSHSLAVPKMFEAGMSKDEMACKRKTMEAFLSGNKSPTFDEGLKVRRASSINRVKTSQKISTQSRSSGGLSRSRTLPDMVCPELLDESNVDKAFDELFQSS